MLALILIKCICHPDDLFIEPNPDRAALVVLKNHPSTSEPWHAGSADQSTSQVQAIHLSDCIWASPQGLGGETGKGGVVRRGCVHAAELLQAVDLRTQG